MQEKTPEPSHCLDETEPVTRLDGMRKGDVERLFCGRLKPRLSQESE
jgi:hypothetical protein